MQLLSREEDCRCFARNVEASVVSPLCKRALAYFTLIKMRFGQCEKIESKLVNYARRNGIRSDKEVRIFHKFLWLPCSYKSVLEFGHYEVTMQRSLAP